MNTYDLHITIPGKHADEVERELAPLWKLLRIENVGAPMHHIISTKFAGGSHLAEPMSVVIGMTKQLNEWGVGIERVKIEQHITPENIHEQINTNGIVEEHIKSQLGFTSSPQSRLTEALQTYEAAGSKVKDKSIISFRYRSIEEWLMYREARPPQWVSEVEMELVVFDSNPTMDAFWPVVTQPIHLLSLAQAIYFSD